MLKLENIPAFKFAIFLCIGIIIGARFIINPFVQIILLVALTFVIIIYAIKSENNLFKTVSVFLLIILLGIFKSNIDFHYRYNDNVRLINDTPKDETYIITGIIDEIPDIDSSRVKFILESEMIITYKDTLTAKGKVMVNIVKSRFNENVQLPDLQYGDKIIASGLLANPPEQNNPGEFNYRYYLGLHNIHKYFTVFGYDDIKILSKNNLSTFDKYIIYPAKNYSLLNINKYNPGQEGAFLKALVTGERSDLTDDTKEDFVKAGVAHLIAVSGLNVAYLILIVMLTLSLLRIPRIPKAIISIIIIILYCFFSGGAASIIRASIMGILFLLSILIERKVNPYNIIGFSAILILLYDSKQLFDAGFILSFISVLSIIYFYDRFLKSHIEKIPLKNSLFRRTAIFLYVIFLTSLSAQLGTLPFNALYFEKISIISLMSNLIAIPLSNLSLAIGFFQIIVSLFSEHLCSIIAETNNLLLYITLNFIKFCGSLDFSYINIYNFTVFTTIIYFIVLILLTSANRKNIRFRITISVLIILFYVVINKDSSGKLKVTFLSTGDMECSLIVTPAGLNILSISSSDYTTSFNQWKTIIPYLKRNNIENIELLILNNYDDRQIVTIKYLTEEFNIRRILCPDNEAISKINNNLMNILLTKNTHTELIKSGDMILTSDSVRVYFLYSGSYFWSESPVDKNSKSLVYKLQYLDTEILFSGNIDREEEILLCERYNVFMKSDILTVSNGGDAQSSIIPFLIRVRPDFSVISCRKFNRYKLPSETVLNRLQKLNSRIFNTGTDGAVIFESDGYNINVINWK